MMYLRWVFLQALMFDISEDWPNKRKILYPQSFALAICTIVV